MRLVSCLVGSLAKNILRDGKFYTLELLGEEHEKNYGLFNKQYGLLEYESFSLPQAIATFNWYEEAMEELQLPDQQPAEENIVEFPDPTRH